ncbi:NAD-dependent epimerase/dehydratase family protein [Modestobacter sp. I12A-02628]|uniref:NAD(P)-dependent oxidoreductase n=1 Tax=Goekera deserti TaxID=2497753 RepID=A0A7K3WBI5_9ACTN|nr:NAD(P)-dependent oxidoreductase [Goekera deserti]MPQ98247.1 NAD-dependent epimerase/dehydratase family protein [Goekera deserti]NDI48073.1 NAD-dependent epimerase/dehydratase family protein [Goekera deserti]NEL53822.1 NAD(P)-dependent oxidoreductase [Goekera deserti]
MHVFVAGGSGVLGRPLVQQLVTLGHQVTASTHSDRTASLVRQLGAEPVVLDAFDRDAVHAAVLRARPEVLVNQLTSLSTPATDHARWLATTNRLRAEASATLAQAARAAGTRRVVAQSASFMTAPDAPAPTDERSPLYTGAPEPVLGHVLANAALERVVTGTPDVEGVVLRYGFLYGPGTALGPGGELWEAVRAGRVPVVGEGRGSYPFVHTLDAVAATVLAVEQGPAGVYNVVDDDPAAQARWLPHLARLLHAPEPGRSTAADAGRQQGAQAVYYGEQLPPASNAAAREHLGWRPRLASWQEGFATLVA